MSRSRKHVGSIEWNRTHWGDSAAWEESGNSWTFHADSCGQPYEWWKKTLLGEFLEPYLGLDADFLEIGPGYGRWTEFMVGRTRSLTLVDLNSNCIEVCRERFASLSNISFAANDGRSLPVPDGSIDVVWSFGSFVHFDTREIAAYLGECAACPQSWWPLRDPSRRLARMELDHTPRDETHGTFRPSAPAPHLTGTVAPRWRQNSDVCALVRILGLSERPLCRGAGPHLGRGPRIRLGVQRRDQHRSGCAAWRSWRSRVTLRRPGAHPMTSTAKSGGRGIRTPGGSHPKAFQEPRISPLCHPSGPRG